jgi:hypothetical protein
MNYAKWITYFPPNSDEGFTPEKEIAERGGVIDGIVALPNFGYVGYIFGNVDLDGLENYQITLLDSEEALELAQSVNPKITFGDDGKFVWPPVDFIALESA